MIFCPKCGSLLKTKLERGKTVMACSCGYSTKSPSDTCIKEEVKNNNKKIDIIDSEVETLPVVEVKCDKCNNNKARFWLVQTRAGDEAETKFFRCTKCKHTWRDYD